jgi:hypothetical protein
MITLKPFAPKLLERDIESYLFRSIRDQIGGRAYKFTSPSRRSVPDRIIVLPHGRVHFVEVKRPDGRLSPGQRREIRFLRSLGQTVHVVWSLAGVDKYISSL